MTSPSGPLEFPTGTGAGGVGGPVTIFTIPKAIANHEIWFDTGHGTKTTTTTEGSHRLSNDFGVNSKGQIGKSVTKKSPTSTEILRSPQQIMAQFAAMSANDPEKYYSLQYALASGPWGTVNPTGAFDHSTELALGNAMLQYVKLASTGVGMSFYDYIIKTGEQAQALGGKGTSLGAGGLGGSGPSYSTVQQTDPATIRAAAQQAAQQALGEGLSDNQLDAFVTQFQAAQVKAQTTPAGTTATTPDLTGQAMAYAQQTNPQAYQANQHDAYLDTLVNMFAPSGSARPTMTPTPSV